jgi:hypothetical protein
VTYLRRQLLDQTFTGSIGEVVELLAGLNAQTPRGPIVSLWTRMARLDLADLDAALGRYEFVKANLMRGTVHLVTRRQYLTWRRALQPMLERTVRGFTPGLWTSVDHDELLDAGTDLLRAHDGLSRAEIGHALADRFPHPEPRQLGFAIRMLLPVVQVADAHAWRPARTRYVLAEQVLDESLTEPEEGAVDLMRGYLRAFGPATAADAGYWSGLSRLAPALGQAADVMDRRPATFDLTPCADAPARARFALPEFDNVYFCSKNPELPLIAAKKRLVSRAGSMPGSLVSNEQVCAEWRWDRAAAGVTLTPWRDLDAAELAEFERFRAWSAAVSAA